MVPAYSCYEYINRVLIPGGVVTAGSIYLTAPDTPLTTAVLIIALAAVPAGVALDVLRDWTAFFFELASRRIRPLRHCYAGIRHHFREFYFHLQRNHGMADRDASRTQLGFLSSLPERDLYFLAVRQSWAALGVNLFFAGKVLLALELWQSWQGHHWSPQRLGILLAATVFFYFAGLYRLRSVTRAYNLLLDDYVLASATSAWTPSISLRPRLTEIPPVAAARPLTSHSPQHGA
jgi:hypothetical protein